MLMSRAPGSLQIALLDALGSAVAMIAIREDALQRIGRTLVDAAERVGQARLKDLGAAVGNYLLHAVRRHLGDDAAQVLSDMADSLIASQGESLSARITAASDDDVVDLLVGFLQEASALAGETSVLLALDGLERLSDDDQRRLADVADKLPGGVSIRASYAASDSDSRRRADELAIAGAQLLPLTGLDVDAVREWLANVGLDARLAEAVVAATNGYGMHVADAISLLAFDPRPATLQALTPTDVVSARARLAWNSLDFLTQISVARLLVYPSAVTDERVCQLLAMDGFAWRALQLRLIDAGLMVESANPWFHELRRRVLWDFVLTEETKQSALEAARIELSAQLELPGAQASDFMTFSMVSAQTIDGNAPGVNEALALSVDELAIAAATLELVEFDQGEQAIIASPVVQHARSAFGLAGNAADAIEGLAASGLIHVASNETTTVIVPTWRSADAVAALLGRSANELGRLPITQIASLLFQTVVARELGEFDRGIYGVGDPDGPELVRQLAELLRDINRGTTRLPPPETPCMLAKADFGGVPLYLAIAFFTAEQRDGALARLTGLEAEVLDTLLRVHFIAPNPGPPVPSGRFANAWRLVSGAVDDSQRSNLSLDEEVRERVQLLNALRLVCTPLERTVYGLEREIGYVYGGDASGSTLVEITGLNQALRVPGDSHQGLFVSNDRLRMLHSLEVPASARFGRATTRFGIATRDGIEAEIKALDESARSFNQHSRRAEFALTEHHLGPALDEAMKRRYSDAAQIVGSMTAGQPDLSVTRTLILLELDEPQRGFVDGAHARLLTATFDHGGADQPETELRVVPGDPTTGHRRSREEPLERVKSAFGVDTSNALSWTSGMALFSLSAMLGYQTDEVRFRY
ncbi:MAG: hypothetical protein R8G01_00655 [Ilumatobacteraceae bacterium]|nr:hypothetical protein [Ilumatobacteraceae bacterium]